MILVNFVSFSEKSRRVAVASARRVPPTMLHERFREIPLDTVSRNARRFIVFDSLNAYNFGARLVGNSRRALSCTRSVSGVRRSHARVLHTPAFTRTFLYAKRWVAGIKSGIYVIACKLSYGRKLLSRCLLTLRYDSRL